jgi:hypothetical protein
VSARDELSAMSKPALVARVLELGEALKQANHDRARTTLLAARLLLDLGRARFTAKDLESMKGRQIEMVFGGEQANPTITFTLKVPAQHAAPSVLDAHGKPTIGSAPTR